MIVLATSESVNSWSALVRATAKRRGTTNRTNLTNKGRKKRATV